MIWTIWTISTLVLLFLTGKAYRAASRHGGFNSAKGMTAGDVFRSEVEWLSNEIRVIYAHIGPVFAQILMRGGIRIYRIGEQLYTSFFRSVFGRLDLREGKTTSFFIKHIREFKNELASDDRLSM